MTIKAPMRPILNRICIKRLEEEVTRGGIYLPKEARDGSLKASQGEVVAVGDAVDHMKVGDLIVWGKYAGCEIKRPEGTFVVMNDEDVIAIIDDYHKQ